MYGFGPPRGMRHRRSHEVGLVRHGHLDILFFNFPSYALGSVPGIAQVFCCAVVVVGL